MEQAPRRVLGETESVCPVCLTRLPARRVAEGGAVYLEKNCPDHGAFRVEIWGGHVPYESWSRPKTPSAPVRPATAVTRRGCPFDCGLCPDHRQHSCCVLLEVTARCDLGCPVCFASSGGAAADPPMEALLETLCDLLTRGGPLNLQLSGGEPTMRGDLPALIRAGKAMGHPFFQLNTNGLRLGREPGYAQALAQAGLDCVFLQFDGVTDDIYTALRGRPLLREKRAALEACWAAGLGVVLVPTLRSGVNTDQIGAILDFAAGQMPCVRGVHFQPMAYLGRYPDGAPEERFTLSHLLWEIQRQTGGRMIMADFVPGGAENAYCSFSGSFLVEADGAFRRKAAPKERCCCAAPAPSAADCAAQSRAYVARTWKGAAEADPAQEATASLDAFLEALRSRTLAVSAMAFMDAWNLDLDRLRDCYIHVAEGARLIPFCAYNLTAQNGDCLYRL